MAGGLNLYGFAGGDPVNYADPFGLSSDSLLILDPDVQQAISDLRASNSEADANFSELELSDNWYVIASGNDNRFAQLTLGPGITYGPSNNPDSPFNAIPEALSALKPNVAGATVINLEGVRLNRLDLGNVTWHETGHLLGIERRGAKYSHGECPSPGIPEFRCP